MSVSSVDFPDPVAPMTAVTSPGRAVNETPESTGSSAPGYRKDTSRNSTSPASRSGVTGSTGSRTAGSVSSTSAMRRAQITARGSIIAMNVPIITAVRIWRRYWMKAVREPTSIAPSATRCPPNHSTDAVATCRIIVMTGPMSTNTCPIDRDRAVIRSFASPNRRTSWSSRTKARTTRMPVICSRSTPFTASSRSCISVNIGMSRATSAPTTTTSTGTATHTSHDRPASSRTAMTIPPTDMIGAMTMRLSIMTETVCTCWTSFVPRVMSVAAPNRSVSSAPNRDTARYTSRRRSRPIPVAVRAPNHTAATAVTTWRRATPSMTRPVRRM